MDEHHSRCRGAKPTPELITDYYLCSVPKQSWLKYAQDGPFPELSRQKSTVGSYIAVVDMLPNIWGPFNHNKEAQALEYNCWFVSKVVDIVMHIMKEWVDAPTEAITANTVEAAMVQAEFEYCMRKQGHQAAASAPASPDNSTVKINDQMHIMNSILRKIAEHVKRVASMRWCNLDKEGAGTERRPDPEQGIDLDNTYVHQRDVIALLGSWQGESFEGLAERYELDVEEADLTLRELWRLGSGMKRILTTLATEEIEDPL